MSDQAARAGHPPGPGAARDLVSAGRGEDLVARALALGMAAVVGAVCLWTAREQPLPAPALAAAFLALAVERDVRRSRIPNALTFPALAAALVFGAHSGGWDGLLASLAGAGLALALLFLPFALRWLGAGDVKAVMVLGALWGPSLVPAALWWMFAVGGVLAVGLVAVRGELPHLCARWARSAWHTLRLGRLVYYAPPPGAVAGRGLPFAVAMGLGTAALQQWGTPWP